MLKILRDNLKYLSWILWGVIIVFIAFVFVDFGGARMGGQGRTAAAVVGDREVTYAEYQRQHRNLYERYRQSLGDRFTPELEKQLRLPVQALEQAVTEKILLGEADRTGLRVSDEEVRQAILEVPAFKDERGAFIGDELYQQILRGEGFTPRAFENSVRDQLTVTKLQSILAQTLSVPDADVERAYREQVERAKVRSVYLPVGRYAGRVTTTPAELQAYFDAHPDAFRLPAQRVVNYLLVDAAKLRAKQRVEPAAIAAYYNGHQDEFRQEEQVHARHILLKVDDKRSDDAARREIEALRAELAGGADFAAVASRVSDDPGSKARGGDLGFFGRGRMIKEFEDAAFDATVGAVVGPVKTTFGYHLLKVEEHRGAGVRPLSEVEAGIRAKLVNEGTEKATADRAAALAQKISADKLTSDEQLRALADADVVSWQTTPAFGAEDPVPGIGRATPFSTAAFGLVKGKVSDPVKIPRGWAILSLVEERAARLPQLAEVEARVRQAAERERQAALAKADLEGLRGAVAAGGSLADLARERFGVEAQESAEFSRTGGGIPGVPGTEAAAMAALGLEVGQLGGPYALPTGAVLFQVTERQRFDPTAFAAAKESTRQRLEGEQLNALLDSLVTQRKLDLRVTYDRPLVEELGLEPPAAAGKPTPTR